MPRIEQATRAVLSRTPQAVQYIAKRARDAAKRTREYADSNPLGTLLPRKALPLAGTLAATAIGFKIEQSAAKRGTNLLPDVNISRSQESRLLAITTTLPVATASSAVLTEVQLGSSKPPSVSSSKPPSPHVSSKPPSVYVIAFRQFMCDLRELRDTALLRTLTYFALFTASDDIEHPVGSVVAGATASAGVSTPIEYARTTIQISPETPSWRIYQSFLQAPSKAVRGFTPTLVRELCVTTGLLSTNQLTPKHRIPATFILCALTYPVDLVRAKMQATPPSQAQKKELLRTAFKEVCATSPRSLIRGAGLRGAFVTFNIELFKFYNNMYNGVYDECGSWQEVLNWTPPSSDNPDKPNLTGW